MVDRRMLGTRHSLNDPGEEVHGHFVSLKRIIILTVPLHSPVG